MLLDLGPDIAPRAAIGDVGYSTKANRSWRARGIAPVIPHKDDEKDKPAFFAKTLYKARGRIEQGSGVLKRSSASRSAAKRQPETSAPSSASPLDNA